MERVPARRQPQEIHLPKQFDFHSPTCCLSCSIFLSFFFFRKTNGKSISRKYSKRKTQEQYKTKQPSKKLKHIQILAEEAQQNYHSKNTGKP